MTDCHSSSGLLGLTSRLAGRSSFWWCKHGMGEGDAVTGRGKRKGKRNEKKMNKDNES